MIQVKSRPVIKLRGHGCHADRQKGLQSGAERGDSSLLMENGPSLQVE